MSYSLPETWSIESLVDYFWMVQAMLEADPATAGLATQWLALENDALSERTTRDSARKLLIKASALQRFKDLVWDTTVDRIGDKAMFDAGRDPKKPPYSLMFSSVRPSDAKRLGAVKAGDLGTVLVEKLRAVGKPEYTELADLFATASADLGESDKTRKQRAAESQTHDVRRRAMIDAAEALVDKTQIGILTAYPGDTARVRATLSPWKDPTRVNRASDEDPEKKPE